MPLSQESIVQTNSGTYTGTSGTVTLPSGTTAGNVIIVCSASSGASTTAITGFVPAGVINAYTTQLILNDVAGGVSSWTLSQTGSMTTSWVILEVAGLATSQSPVNANGGDQITAASTTATIAVGVTPFAITALDTLHVCVAGGRVAAGGAPNITATDESYGQPGATLVDLSVRITLGAGNQPTDYALDANGTTCDWSGFHVIYAAEDSPYDPAPYEIYGFEQGTTAGLATGNALSGSTNCRYVESLAGSPAIVTTTARSGDYCLELASTAAAESVTSATRTISGAVQCGRMSVYFPSLPSGDLEIMEVGSAVATLRYITSGTKLGLVVGTGTEQVTAAISAATWYSIDWRLITSTTAHSCEWQITPDGGSATTLTTATFTAAGANTSFPTRFGWTTSSTATVRYDDIMLSSIRNAYPMGDYKIRVCRNHPSTVVTISGTTANFSTFSNNGTIAAWNGTTARDALRDYPPTIGGTAAGAVQITTATNDYMSIPMEPRTGGPTEVPKALRLLACGWAAAATAATISFGVPGIVSRIVPVADYGFDNSTTAPAWVCPILRPSTFGLTSWSQSTIDTLAISAGYSGDASPDIGLHWIGVEVAWKVLPRVQVAATEDGGVINALIDGDWNIPQGYEIVAPAGRGVSGEFIVAGSPVTHAVGAGLTETEVITGGTQGTVTFVGLT